MSANQALVCKLYKSVMEDVISGMKDAFNDEGVDEQVLIELKQLWENKLTSSKAIDPVLDPAEMSLQNRLQRIQRQPGPGNVASVVAKKVVNVPAATNSANAGVASVPAGVLKMVPVQITVPVQPGSAHLTPKSITVHVPSFALQGGTAGAQLKSVLSSPTFTAALSLPVEMSQTLIQQHINQAFKISVKAPTFAISQVPTVNRAAGNSTTDRVAQVDGPGDTSDEDDDDEETPDEDVETPDEERDEEDQENEQEDQNVEPLNSDDDVAEEDPSLLFETENVVVCQYDKITKNRNRWKLLLKDGVMHINGRDYVFQKANGDADW